jgi:putative exosortase-associated protein (TIGR04073 family)
MRNFLITMLLVLTVAAVSFHSVGTAYAGETLDGMGNKLKRGIVNTATGWIELPKAIKDEVKKHDPLTGLVVGSIKGSGMAVVRTGTGGYEAGTFLFPVPKDYASVLEPEYLF